MDNNILNRIVMLELTVDTLYNILIESGAMTTSQFEHILQKKANAYNKMLEKQSTTELMKFLVNLQLNINKNITA